MKDRQICFFIIAFLPTTKIFTMPCFLTRIAGRDMLICYLFSFLLDFLILQIILLTCNKNENYYDLLNANVKTVPTKTIYLLYGVFFFFKAMLYCLEHKLYTEYSLYQTEAHLINTVPILLFGLFLSTRNIRSIARLSDILAIPTAFAIIALVVLSFSSGDYLSFLPILAEGTKKPLFAVLTSFTWGGDGVYLLFLLEDVKVKKNTRLKVSLSYLLGGLLTASLLAVFYAVFGEVGREKTFAFSEISAYSVFLSNTARFDYMAIFVILLSTVVGATLPIYFYSNCMQKSFPLKYGVIYPIVAVVLFIAVFVIFDRRVLQLLENSIRVFPYIAIVFNFIIPVFSVFLRRKANEF